MYLDVNTDDEADGTHKEWYQKCFLDKNKKGSIQVKGKYDQANQTLKFSISDYFNGDKLLEAFRRISQDNPDSGSFKKLDAEKYLIRAFKLLKKLGSSLVFKHEINYNKLSFTLKVQLPG